MRFPSLRSAALGTAVTGALVLAACGGGGDGESPEPTDTPPEPTATQPPDNGGGGGELFGGKPVAEFFAANCVACHGADRKGISGLGLPLLPDVLTEGDDFYFDTIKNGRTGTAMPSWSATAGLSDEEITDLVAFIRTEP